MTKPALHTQFEGIAALRAALAQRQVSAVELAQSALTAADAASGLNCFLHIDAELTLAQARAADAALADGSAGPLAGVPIAHKDAFVTRGWRTTAGSQPLKGLRIGVPEEYFGAGLAADVAAAVEAALTQFEALGAVRVPVSLPRTELAIPAYYVIAPAEASSNLARYDGVRYGHRTEQYGDLNEMISRSRAEGFGDEVKRRILIGTYVLSHGYYDAYYLQAQRLRRLIAQDFQRAYADQCDVIMGPVTPSVAKNIGDNRDDPTADWLADVYTLGVSLAGLPAMSIPCGFGGDNGKRPVGLQIIGNYFDEGRLLAIADRYQQVTDWHKRSPL
jgi:aspartyl-tRNA(Asn)/glutamyl-tRNA(Gln) amidotransferase subunit A